MNPGVTHRPSASMTRPASDGSTRPTSATRPSRIATSAVKAGSPVPSHTFPPRTTTSYAVTALSLSLDWGETVEAGGVQAEEPGAGVGLHAFGVLRELVDDTRVLRVAVREVRCPDEGVGAGEGM